MFKNSKIYPKLKVKSPKTSNFRQIHYPTFAGKSSKKSLPKRNSKEVAVGSGRSNINQQFSSSNSYKTDYTSVGKWEGLGDLVLRLFVYKCAFDAIDAIVRRYLLIY